MMIYTFDHFGILIDTLFSDPTKVTYSSGISVKTQTVAPVESLNNSISQRKPSTYYLIPTG